MKQLPVDKVLRVRRLLRLNILLLLWFLHFPFTWFSLVNTVHCRNARQLSLFIISWRLVAWCTWLWSGSAAWWVNPSGFLLNQIVISWQIANYKESVLIVKSHRHIFMDTISTIQIQTGYKKLQRRNRPDTPTNYSFYQATQLSNTQQPWRNW